MWFFIGTILERVIRGPFELWRFSWLYCWECSLQLQLWTVSFFPEKGEKMLSIHSWYCVLLNAFNIEWPWLYLEWKFCTVWSGSGAGLFLLLSSLHSSLPRVPNKIDKCINAFLLVRLSTTLQSMMKAKFCQHNYVNRHINAIQTIPHNLCVSCKLA